MAWMGKTNTQAHLTREGKNGGTLTPFTPDRARAAQVRSVQSRRNRAMQAARDRTVQRLAASDNTITSWADAWGEMVADQAEALRQAASEGKPRGDDMMQVGQALGAVPMAYETRDTGQQQPSINIAVIDPAAADAILQALAVIRGETVDATAQDVDK